MGFKIENVINHMYSINEVLITLGGKAYPKFGNVVILSGGAGSGKGFIKKRLLGIEGITFDVDNLKSLVLANDKFNASIKDKYGIDTKDLNLKNKDDVSKAHDIISDMKISDKNMKKIFTSIKTAHPNRKPNLIFDVTLKDITKFYNLIRRVQEVGYDKKDIHLVWVLNTIKVALEQNKKRSRTVADEILLSTHEGASYTMKSLLDKGKDLRKFMDGDIHLAFNQSGVDSNLIKSEDDGSYLADIKDINNNLIKRGADYVTLKRKGKSPLTTKEIDNKVLGKIKSYVPNSNIWS